MKKVSMRSLSLAAVALCATLITGCGGGGSSSLVAKPATAAPAGPVVSGTSKVTMTISRLTRVATASSSAARSTKSLSFVAAGLKVVILDKTGATLATDIFDISGATFASGVSCYASNSNYNNCTISFDAPNATAALNVSACDDTKCQGNVLDTGTAQVTFVVGAANAVSITLGGVAASLKLYAADQGPVVGTSETIPLVVQLYDAAGAVILGPDNYVNPITVTDSDTSGTSGLILTAVQDFDFNTPSPQPGSAPAASVTVTSRYYQPSLVYQGTGTGTFSISAGTTGLTNASVTITPTTTAHAAVSVYGPTAYTVGTTGQQIDSVIYDGSGTPWAILRTPDPNNQGQYLASTSFQQLSNSTFAAVGQPYTIALSGVSGIINPRHVIEGPDGNLWFTVKAGIVSFNKNSHAFTLYSTTSSPGAITSTGASVIATEPTSSIIASIPFSGSPPYATLTLTGTAANETTLAAPAGSNTSSLAVTPVPQYPSVTADGKIWITEFANLGGATYISQINADGTKIAGTENLVNPASPDVVLIPNAASTVSGATTIYYADNAGNGQYYVYDTATKSIATTFTSPTVSKVPQLGVDTAVAPSDGSFWFGVSDEFGNEIALYRRDPSGRIDAIPYNLSYIYTLTLSPFGTIFFSGANGSTATTNKFVVSP
jgi:hypothetical protein